MVAVRVAVTSLCLFAARPVTAPRLAPSSTPHLAPHARTRAPAHRSAGVASATAFGSAAAMPPLRYPPPTVLEPKNGQPATAAVFLMHGLGDTAAGWEDVAYQLRSALPYARFILPTAPVRPITCNGGFPMPGWYDIASLDSLQGREDKAGVTASADFIAGLLADSGIPPNRCVMAGFSQGGAMALSMLNATGGDGTPLAGVISMSGYLPLATSASPPPLTTPANAATPVLFCHGDADEVVKYAYGVASADALKAAGTPVTFQTYRGMGHSACPSELEDVADFLKARLPPQ